MQVDSLNFSEPSDGSISNEALGDLLFVVLDSGEIASWKMDYQTGEILWSQELRTLFELDKKQNISRKCFIEKIHRDYREDFKRKLELAIFHKRKQTHTVFPIKLLDGQLRWIDQRSTIRYSAQDEPIEVISFCWDATEQKEQEISLRSSVERLEKVKNLLHASERKLRTVLNSTNAKVVAINPDQKMEMGNKSFYDLIVLPVYHAVGQPMEYVLGQSNWRKILPYFDLVLKTSNQISFDTNLEFSTKNCQRYFRVSLHPEIDANGAINSVLGTFLDVSEQKKLEFSLRGAKNSAELASKHKSEFLSRMSHEMRTPLHAIMAFTDILESTHLNETQLNYIDIMKKSEQHLLGVINDVLSLSQIESGKLELHVKPFDMVKLIQDCLAIFSSVATDSTGFRLESQIDWECSQFVLGDEQRIRQVLMNLISNAIKFTQLGQVTVSLSGKVKNETVQVELSVEDTGPGIEKSKVAKIFESFHRLKSHSEIPGSGLGLAICKGIVDKMGGKISVSSEVGVGSKFTCNIDLPLDESHSVALPLEKPSIESQFFNNIHRVLVADDDPINIKIMQTYFEDKELDLVEYVTDGKKALELYQEHLKNPFDLVLMDMRMPEMDGYQATQEIRNIERQHNTHPKALIIALSATSLKEEVDKCIQVGCDLHLSKPISFDSLIEQISRLF